METKIVIFPYEKEDFIFEVSLNLKRIFNWITNHFLILSKFNQIPPSITIVKDCGLVFHGTLVLGFKVK
jgi:hypothetical protein